MPLFIKILLIISFISVPARIISSVVTGGGLLISALFLVINAGVFAILWQTTKYAVNNPEDQTQIIWAQVARWVSLLYLSITSTELGVLASFVLRFAIDATLSPRYSRYYPIWNIISLLLAMPILFLVGRGLKFSKPIVPVIIAIILWSVILFLGPLLVSS